MLIRLQGALRVGNSAYKAGDVVDLEETQAILLIKKGLAIKQERTSEKESMLIRLYGSDFPIPMGTLREKVFNEFISTISKKHILKPNPDEYVTSCLTCGGNLLVNKYTGTTYCCGCKQEQPFEYLFEILKGLDIYSIVQEIQNQQPKRKVMRW